MQIELCEFKILALVNVVERYGVAINRLILEK